MVRSQSRSGQVRKISPLPGFDPRTVHPVTSRYTEWAIPDSEVVFTGINSLGVMRLGKWEIMALQEVAFVSLSLQLVKLVPSISVKTSELRS